MSQEEMLFFAIEFHQADNDQRQNFWREVQVVEIGKSSNDIGTQNHICHSDHEPLPESRKGHVAKK